MEKENHNIKFLLMNLLLTIYGIEIVFPPVTTVLNSNIICMLCLLGWIIISFFTDSGYYLCQNIRNTYPLIFYFATAVIPYLFGIGVIGNRYLSLGLIPVGYIIFNYYKQKKRLSDLKRISIIIAFFATITFFITLKALIEDPYISRSIKSSGEHSENLARYGIGGYSFIYFIAVVSVFLLYMSLKSKSKWFRCITFIGYLMSFYFVLKSNYMTALLTVVMASVVLVISYYAEASPTKGVKLFFITVLALVILMNINAIVNKYADFIPKRIASVLVLESGESIYQSILDEFVNDRWPTMLSSIKMLLSHPFFGMVSSNDIQVSQSGGLTGFGQHSHILDTFALYGFVIGIVNIFIIFKPFKDHNGKRIKYGKALNNAMLVCTIVIYLFNNATPSIAFAFGILFPLLREVYDSENKI